MKKNVKKEIAATTNTAESVEKLLTQYDNVSLRKLALAADVTYTLLLKASKEPQVGCAYDPSAINYEKVAQYFNRRKIQLEDLDWEALNQQTSVRAATVCRDTEKFQVGTKWYLRKHPDTPYEIVYRTNTHVVIILEGSTEPQSWSYNTFMLNGPQETPRAVKEEA